MQLSICIHIGVSKNSGGPPKWMVYNEKPYFLMNDLGVALFLEGHPCHANGWLNPTTCFQEKAPWVGPKKGSWVKILRPESYWWGIHRGNWDGWSDISYASYAIEHHG